MTTSTYKDEMTTTPVSLYFLSLNVRTYLMTPRSFSLLAGYFLQVETLIQEQRPTNAPNEINEIGDKRAYAEATTKISTNNAISTDGWNDDDPLIGAQNALVFPAVSCSDMSNEGINTTQSFLESLSYQIDNGNPLVAYEGIAYAECLSWPDLSAHNVERPTDFPSTLKNKILVVGITDDPVTPYTDALATYNFSEAGMLIL